MSISSRSRNWKRLITDYVKNVPPHETNEAADGGVILKAIEAQHGIFVERAHKVYSFSHLTFQEYFTTKYIVANAAKGTLTNLVKEHCADERWREVFLLTTSLLPDASQFMTTFKRDVDKLLGDDEKLGALLTWADKRSTSIQANPGLGRPYYLFIDVYYPSRNHALDRVLVRARDRALDHDRALDLDRPPALDRELARARARALARALDHDRALDSDLARALDSDLALALALARELRLNKFAKELAALSLPIDKAATAELREFVNKLQALTIKHRDIGHEWNLTETQEARLADYVKATELLHDCLELAFMPPDEKKVMLNSLYLPPA